MPIFVERASYSTKRWETIRVMCQWNEMEHIVDNSNPKEIVRYVFGYSDNTPILTRVSGRTIEEMHIIEPGDDYIIEVRGNPTSSKRTIRFRLVE